MRKSYLALIALAVVVAAWVSFGVAKEQQKAQVKIGAAAPAFTLQDQDGKNVSLADFSGKVVVLEWTNPHCPFVLRHYRAKTMQTLAVQYKDKDVAWLAINSTRKTTNESNKDWATSQNIAYPVLNDVETNVGKTYGATNTPEMYIIGKDGTLLYQGAIDNDPDGDKTEGKINYVSKALDEIIAGKSVSVPETEPYGCGVHYKD